MVLLVQQEFAIKNVKTNTYLRQGNGKVITFSDKPTAREYLKIVGLDPNIYRIVEYKVV